MNKPKGRIKKKSAGIATSTLSIHHTVSLIQTVVY